MNRVHFSSNKEGSLFHVLKTQLLKIMLGVLKCFHGLLLPWHNINCALVIMGQVRVQSVYVAINPWQPVL